MCWSGLNVLFAILTLDLYLSKYYNMNVSANRIIFSTSLQLRYYVSIHLSQKEKAYL